MNENAKSIKDRLKDFVWSFSVPYSEEADLAEMIIFGACFFQRNRSITQKWLANITGFSESHISKTVKKMEGVYLEPDTYTPIIHDIEDCKDPFVPAKVSGLNNRWKYFRYFQPSQYSKDLAEKAGYRVVNFHAVYSFLVGYKGNRPIDEPFIGGFLRMDTRTVEKYLELLELQNFIKIERINKKFTVGVYDPDLRYFREKCEQEEVVARFDIDEPQKTLDQDEILKKLGKVSETPSAPAYSEAELAEKKKQEEKLDQIMRELDEMLEQDPYEKETTI